MVRNRIDEEERDEKEEGEWEEKEGSKGRLEVRDSKRRGHVGD